MNEQFILAKADFFSSIHVWPWLESLNPRPWLDNFEQAERPFALQLLNNFLFFNKKHTEEMFQGAFHSISRRFAESSPSFRTAEQAWGAFRETALIVPVEGEVPNPSDSGHIFCRAARQILGVPEDQIKTPEAALDILESQKQPIVFVDDFVGSGEQCIHTWERNYSGRSFAEMYSKGILETAIYCSVTCTEYGKERIKSRCEGIEVIAAHILTDEYSCVAANSVIAPDIPRNEFLSFIRGASNRAGIPEDEQLGFHDLALALAFEHSVPDATLPLFHWETNWAPLARRR